MFDRQQRGDDAVLLNPYQNPGPDSAALSEFTELALSAGASVLAVLNAPLSKPNPRFYVGSGKAEELAELVRDQGANLVLVNHSISAIQERNLEKLTGCRVLDRTALILDIFAQRARTFEGQLQVELAQLRHLSTRLVRGWTHLERQKGGIGLRGPGETQLETDRRLIGARISNLKKRLEKVERQREQSRRSRSRANIPNIALVGYTNVGKSTLFNALTESSVTAKDQLFATLDPTVRRMADPAMRPLLLTDTVGFVSQLPHELVAAFRSTLEETREADLLLHVMDASDPDGQERYAEVIQVLDDIGAGKVPVIKVYNKIDQTDIEPGIDRDSEGRVRAVRVSALAGTGLTELSATIEAAVTENWLEGSVDLPPAAARLRAQLFQLGAVQNESFHSGDAALPEAVDNASQPAPGGSRLQLRLTRDELSQLLRENADYVSLLNGLTTPRLDAESLVAADSGA